jgi:cytochrome c oxidase subunit 3
LLLNQRQRHFFHIVTPSPWPFVFSCAVMSLLFSFVCYIHFIPTAGYHFFLMLFCVCLTFYLWFNDIIAESRLSHTWKTEYLITDSFILFIISEVMFFFSFFWAFFYSSLSPSLWICSSWPPLGITTVNTFNLPLLNTALLLFSGWTVSLAHDSIIYRNRFDFLLYLSYTLLLSCMFTCVQLVEYRYSCFSIYDSVYGSCFYMLTGFHGFHVFLGTIMLVICLIRGFNYQFSPQIHVGFIISSWYWHFVDVVWIFLFFMVYWWGNSSFEGNLQEKVLNYLIHSFNLSI